MAESTPNLPDVKLELVKEISLPTTVLALDADPAQGRRAFAACLDGGVYQVDLEAGTERQLARHESYASGIAWLPGSNQLLSSGYDGALQWYSLEDQKIIRRIQAHKFWSWQLALSRDERWAASVTGQYLAGGYKYEPAGEREPSVRVYDARTGEIRWSFSHVPPVLSAAFSPNHRFLAAANMMGQIRVWDLETGRQAAEWTTPDFTSWGIIKSHHYVGGIFSLAFSPDSAELLAAGMGQMTDPMAGNGKQLWQRFAWQESPPRKTGQIQDGEGGNGLMETILFHPSGQSFLMAGRMAQGKWNAALFDSASGRLIQSIDRKMRITDASFSPSGNDLILAGGTSQEKRKDGKCPKFGRIKTYRIA